MTGETPTSINMSTPSPTLYFAFGSNLWLHQMSLRCPSSQYLGLARLPSYRWLINERGYANVVETNMSSSTIPTTTTTTTSHPTHYANQVWGMVYSLSPTDESALDKNEGVPHAYTKHHLPCSFWALAHPIPPPRDDGDAYPPSIDVSVPPAAEQVKMLVYVDLKRTTDSTPRAEYVYRMNRGIDDMVRCGVPAGYVRGVLRGYIPVADDDEGGGEGVEEFARGQARGFRDESGIF